jgi:hypothetical protein
VKIDTGANANALPLRTFKQMFGNKQPLSILLPVRKEKLTAYSGDTLRCLGSMAINCHNAGSARLSTLLMCLDLSSWGCQIADVWAWSRSNASWFKQSIGLSHPSHQSMT